MYKSLNWKSYRGVTILNLPTKRSDMTEEFVSSLRVVFSIVTVNLNNVEGLSRTMDSVLRQSFRDFEWIVIDALSHDGSIELVESVSDERAIICSEKDEGLYDGMNKGLACAKGEWIIFMNSGDTFADYEVLCKVSEFTKNDHFDIIYGDAIEVGAHERIVKRAMPHWLVIYSMFTHHQAIFYRRAALGDVTYNIGFKRVADWALTAKLLKQGAKARHIKIVICLFERGGISQAAKNIDQAKAEMVRLHHEVLNVPRVISKVVVYVKFFVNNFRKRWPKIYDYIRGRV